MRLRSDDRRTIRTRLEWLRLAGVEGLAPGRAGSPVGGIERVRLVDSRLERLGSSVQSAQGTGSPPVQVPGQSHEGRHQDAAHERGVDEDGEREPQPQELDEGDL